MLIREAEDEDWQAIWPFFKQIVQSGDSYPYSPSTTYEEGFTLWLRAPQKTYVIEDDNEILGSYYIKANQTGLGGHVCNCGYMVSESARGKGVATQLCEHSQKIARELGYKAMQFNLVVSTNERAYSLWKKMGFKTVGTLPKAFNHSLHGLVDAYVMYKWLD